MGALTRDVLDGMSKISLIVLIFFACICLPVFADDCKPLVNADRLDNALTCYMQKGAEPTNYVNIGTVYTLMKKYDMALKYFELAYKLDSNNPAIKYAYGVGLINASKNNPVINFAFNNQDNSSSFEYISKINNTDIYSQTNLHELHGEIVKAQY